MMFDFRKRHFRAVFGASAALLLMGASDERPVSANSSIGGGMDAAPPTDTQKGNVKYVITYFITNRKVDLKAEQTARNNSKILSTDDVFTSELARGASHGWIEIGYPASHRVGDQTYSRDRENRNSLDYFATNRYDTFNTVEAFNESRANSPTTKSTPPMVFVHGFNNTFREAAERMGQLVVDLNLPAKSVIISWPSDRARLGAPDYLAMYTSAYKTSQGMEKATIPMFAEALRTSFSDNTPIWIMAHSMGAELATHALLDVAAADQIFPDIRSLMLVAADIDRDAFRDDHLPKLAFLNGRIIAYCADDAALSRSSTVNKSGPRLGYCRDDRSSTPQFSYPESAPVAQGEPIRLTQPMPGIEVVEVQGHFTDWPQHGYYLVKEVLEDVRSVLARDKGSLPTGGNRKLILP